MRVAYSLADVPAEVKPTAVTIGVFDGVHTGHQVLIRRVIEQARARGATPAVVTFDRHPLELLAPGKEPVRLTTIPQRAEILEGLGIGLMLVLRFDEGVRRLTAEDFVRRVLIDALGAVHVVVGSNFRFGYQHSGTVQTLHELGQIWGFSVDIFSLLGGENAVSSTLIRRHLADGQVEQIAEELGRPFRVEGVVERGAGRGRQLGVPTANLALDPKVGLPKVGVYAAWVTWQGRRYPAVVDVGLAPMFEDRSHPVVEAHLIGFDGDLYGQAVAVEFTHRIRDELRFDDVSALLSAIDQDISEGRRLLGLPESS